MKLARSTTFKPEKMLSLAIVDSLECKTSLAVELRRALFEEGGRALFLVLRRGAEPEIGSFEQQPFVLTRLHPFVRRFEGVFHRDGSIGGDVLQDLLSARDQIPMRYDLVDEPDAIRLRRADHFS